MAFGTLILVDGTALAYRAFFAIRGLSTAAGRPTNAVFGFVRMLRQLREAWRPTHGAVVFDGGLSAERMALLEEYKAQRPRMPEALEQQLATIQEYLRRADVCCLLEPGQEADDLLASLAARAAGEFAEVLIATSDKDFYQLVGEAVHLVPLAGKGERTTAAAVKQKTGVEPGQIVEWLALAGDASDNIPGVPGVGPKTAAELLGRYGTLEGIRRHVGELRNERLRGSLEASEALLRRNVALARLRTDLPCPDDWQRMALRAPQPARLLPFFEELEFKALARELSQPELL
jgi:5'-3' exonuclease